MCHSNATHIRFEDDYSKVTYGMRNTLQLIHKDDNYALFRTAAAGAGKIVLSKLAWYVPILQPNDVRKVNLYKIIAANNAIPYRSVCVNVKRSLYLKHHCNLTNMQVWLNHSSTLPGADLC